jgi:hypothetical protein
LALKGEGLMKQRAGAEQAGALSAEGRKRRVAFLGHKLWQHPQPLSQTLHHQSQYLTALDILSPTTTTTTDLTTTIPSTLSVNHPTEHSSRNGD